MEHNNMRQEGEPILALESGRMAAQLKLVRALMLDGGWRTLEEISEVTNASQASVSARLRDLRKPRFGSYLVERRKAGRGLYQYRVSARGPSWFSPTVVITPSAATLQRMVTQLTAELSRIRRSKKCSTCQSQMDFLDDCT